MLNILEDHSDREFERDLEDGNSLESYDAEFKCTGAREPHCMLALERA